MRHPSDVEAVASVKSRCCYSVGMDGSHDPSIAELSIVLRCVVDCDDRLDREYLDPIAGTKLLRSNELLKSKVADALKTGSYRDVRNLSTHVNHL